MVENTSAPRVLIIPRSTKSRDNLRQIIDSTIPEKSIGHIGFIGNEEFLHIGGNNSVYRVPINNPMEKTPYGNIRTGARFESTYTAWLRAPLKTMIEKENSAKIIDADQDRRDQLTTRLSLRREK